MRIFEFLDSLQEWVLDAASGWWTLLGLFGFVTVNGFFPPLPSDSLIIALGSVQDQPGTPWWPWVIMTAGAAAILGDIVAYRLGRAIGTDRFRWMRRPAMQRTLAWARHGLDKRGVPVIFVGRFIPGARVGINFVAGSTGYSLPRFVLIDSVASLLWASWLVTLGAVGDAIFGHMLLAMVVGIAFAVVVGLVCERIFSWITRWLDRRGVHLDPEGYQDTSAIDLPPPVRLRRHREDEE
ncbi:DedA family protein [Nesterenkonia sp. NBAIMH1]|uniref:DedA family protein n=1 Tax=Nesterenkonia sp. NBAIMH1 TaxID=2600320 RepID=UPI0011B79108|nr:DedA family protein [Nesterenkonia sp. NBAIMH1]